MRKKKKKKRGFLGLNLFFPSLSNRAHVDHIQSWVIANLCQVIKLLRNEKYPPKFNHLHFPNVRDSTASNTQEFGYAADSRGGIKKNRLGTL